MPKRSTHSRVAIQRSDITLLLNVGSDDFGTRDDDYRRLWALAGRLAAALPPDQITMLLQESVSTLLSENATAPLRLLLDNLLGFVAPEVLSNVSVDVLAPLLTHDDADLREAALDYIARWASPPA